MAELSVSAIQAAIERGGLQWKAGESPVSRLSRADQLRRLGVSPPLGARSMEQALKLAQEARSTSQASTVAIPSSFDLRNVGGANYVTAVKDQGNCGSCVAFGACATVESTHAWINKVSNPTLDLSEAQLFFCHAESEGRTCETGWWPSKAFAYFANKGIADEKCYPYRLPSDHCLGRCADWEGRSKRIQGAVPLNGVDAMRQWLATNGSISACFVVYEDFFSYAGGIYKHATGGEAGGHCICIVGYDNPSSSWICKNSWGPQWGENGFFRIEFGQCAIETWEVHGVHGVSRA